MILGVGVDLVDLNRFENKLETNQNLAKRLFTDNELEAKTQSLAGYFAAKEAVIKAFGHSNGVSFQEIEICKDEHGKPELLVLGNTAEVAKRAGISKWHLSISHDAGMAIAMVIAEGARP